MIIYIDFLMALVFGLLITIVIAGWFKRRGPWSGMFIFFIIVFLSSWAAGIWLIPFGPTIYGVNWIPFLIGGLIVGLILAAAAPRIFPRTHPKEEVKEHNRRFLTAEDFDVFLVVTLIVLIVAVVVGYFVPGWETI
ncbi:MAG: hypothetical protein ACLFST_05070 [Spirochaetia bacterium]